MKLECFVTIFALLTFLTIATPCFALENFTAASPSFSINNDNQLTNTVVLELKPLTSVGEGFFQVEAVSNASHFFKVLKSNTSVLTLKLAPSVYEFRIYYDDPSTPNKDLYSGFEVSITDDLQLTVFLKPIGFVKGFVYDSFKNLVPNADLIFECDNEEFNASTNSFGSFYLQLPAGTCFVMAKHNNLAGFSNVTVKQGFTTQVSITLEKNVGKSFKPYFLALITIASLALIFIIVLELKRFAKKGLNKKGSNKKVKRSKTLTQAQRAILETLSAREKLVVQYLLQHSKEKVWFSKIARDLQIPKTSLARIIARLESKNILTTEKFGKALKIKVSDWFLKQ